MLYYHPTCCRLDIYPAARSCNPFVDHSSEAFRGRLPVPRQYLQVLPDQGLLLLSVMLQSRKSYLALVGVVAWSSTTVDAVLSILEAASLSTTHSSLASIAAMAGTLDLVSLCCIGFYTLHNVGNVRGALERSGKASKALIAISILLSSVALTLSLALIIVIKSRWDEITAASPVAPISNWSNHVSAQIALWIISCASQVVLYTSPLWNRKAPKVQTVVTSGPRDSVISELRAHRPSDLFLGKAVEPSSPLAAHHRPEAMGSLPSPTLSIQSSKSLKSFRESLRHVVRPVTSRTTLISQRSFSRDAAPSIYSNRQSSDTISHSDGFDSWDTSGVIIPTRDVVLQQTMPYKGTTLEPIPGSRPNSLARALDGSFLSELPEEDDEELYPPPRMMPDVSRPPSPAVSEAHIHPLFRSESPSGLPPPAATPGTSIMASPYSNQAIACPPRSFNRMRSSSQLSQTNTINSLHHTRSFTRDRPGSVGSKSRSPSPPSRAITPPIPDFVLNTSPRTSINGSRRVNLQYSPDR